jgi:hypothetical protein
MTVAVIVKIIKIEKSNALGCILIVLFNELYSLILFKKSVVF